MVGIPPIQMVTDGDDLLLLYQGYILGNMVQTGIDVLPFLVFIWIYGVRCMELDG